MYKVISRKAIKIQKNGTLICKCHFFCVSLQPKNIKIILDTPNWHHNYIQYE